MGSENGKKSNIMYVFEATAMCNSLSHILCCQVNSASVSWNNSMVYPYQVICEMLFVFVCVLQVFNQCVIQNLAVCLPTVVMCCISLLVLTDVFRMVYRINVWFLDSGVGWGWIFTLTYESGSDKQVRNGSNAWRLYWVLFKQTT